MTGLTTSLIDVAEVQKALAVNRAAKATPVVVPWVSKNQEKNE